MTLTLELSPELETRLREVAAQRGQDTATFVTAAVEEVLHWNATAPAVMDATYDTSRFSMEEFEAAMDEFSAGSESLPVLAPEATTRAGVYGDHD